LPRKGLDVDGVNVITAPTDAGVLVELWEEAEARLRPVSDLERRAAQARTEYERAGQFHRYETDVRTGKAKPPVVVLAPQAPPRYYLGACLRCSREMWMHSPKHRVPICGGAGHEHLHAVRSAVLPQAPDGPRTSRPALLPVLRPDPQRRAPCAAPSREGGRPMSREPSSAMHRGWRAFEQEPEPSQPKPGPPKRIPRIRVENPGEDKAINKLLTTTEKLSAEERKIVRGYRLSTGGDAARLERMRIDLDILEGR
jgi:hypothetical protein